MKSSGPEFYLSSYNIGIPPYVEVHTHQRDLSTAIGRATADHVRMFQLLFEDFDLFWSNIPEFRHCEAHGCHSGCGSSSIAATIANVLTYAEYYDIMPLLGPKLRCVLETATPDFCKFGTSKLAEQVVFAIPIHKEFYLAVGEMMRSVEILEEVLCHHIGHLIRLEKREVALEVPCLSKNLNSILPILSRRYRRMLDEFEDTVVRATYTEHSDSTTRWNALSSKQKKLRYCDEEHIEQLMDMFLNYKADLTAERFFRTAIHTIRDKDQETWFIDFLKKLRPTIVSMKDDVEGEEFQTFLDDLCAWGYSNPIENTDALKEKFVQYFEARMGELEELIEDTYGEASQRDGEWPRAINDAVPYLTNLRILGTEWPRKGKPKWTWCYFIRNRKRGFEEMDQC